MSIETRKEQGEAYSTVAGFFKQYELVYIVADERDVIGVRTTYRQPQEDVYVYRLHGPRENLRRVFLDYLRGMNELRARPQFYNSVTTNCTTGVLLHARVNPGSPPWSWKILLSGYFPEYAYELGRLDTSRPFRISSACRASTSGPTPRAGIPHSRSASATACRCRPLGADPPWPGDRGGRRIGTAPSEKVASYGPNETSAPRRN